jgi:hypothetical protein
MIEARTLYGAWLEHAHQPHINLTSTAHQLHINCTSTAHQLHINCTSTARQLHVDRTETAQQRSAMALGACDPYLAPHTSSTASM